MVRSRDRRNHRKFLISVVETGGLHHSDLIPDIEVIRVEMPDQAAAARSIRTNACSNGLGSSWIH